MLDFDSLREELLRAGIAPRHARRYLTELRHHYDDLLAEERARGLTGPEANEAAITRLGSNDELAAALLAKPELRSITARYPWLAFGILPPVATLLLGTLVYAIVYFIGNDAAKINAVVPLPQNWLIGFSTAAMTAVNALAVPVIAMTLAWLAARQRLKLVWPLLGIALLLLATPMFASKFGHHHDAYLRVGYGLVIPARWSQIMRFWPLMLSHLLALLAVAWLIYHRRRAA